MENQEKEITIGQLFGVFKKSLKRGLLYVLIAVFFTVAVLYAIKTFTDTKVYTTTVVFSDEDESVLPKLNAGKSTVINKALKDKNDASLNEAVLSNLSVAAKDVDTEDKEFIPDTFVISLKSDKKIGFTNDEYKNVLDNIADEYVNLLTSENLQTLSAFTYSENELNNTEYMEQAIELSDIASDYIKVIEQQLKDIENLDKFSYNEKTVNALLSDLKSANSILERCKNYIISYKIEITTGSLENYLESNKNIASNQVTILSDQITSINESIAAYKNVLDTVTKDTNGNNLYQYNDDNFMKLVQQKTDLEAAKATASGKVKDYGTYLDKLEHATTNETITAEVKGSQSKDGLIKTAFKTIDSTVKNYNELAKQYNANVQVNTAKYRIDNAYAYNESVISMKIILLLAIVVALIVYIVAFSQTFAKMKQNGYFN